MSEPPVRPTLALTHAQEVDRVCDRFEAAWAAGGPRPRVEDFFGGVTGPYRLALLAELVRLDAHYRREAGDAPTPAEYAARFPDLDADWLATALTAPAAGPAPTVVGGHEVLGELGRGGMGVVFKARQVKLNRVVALKMVLGADRADSKELVRFLTEAEAVAAVDHPHVVSVYEFGDAGGRPFLAMEFCPGGSLAERLRAAGRLEPRTSAELVQKVARGVQAAHDQGIVHRDLKPANVLFDEHGEPKVTDFGLAKRGTGGGLTVSNALLGTPAYMAPEQAGGRAKYVGPAGDVWALGVILYECLTGKRPFASDDTYDLLHQIATTDPPPPRAVAPGVPKDLDLICRACLRKDPADRYRSAAALADDLGRFLAGEAVTIRSAGPAERAARWAARNPWVAGLAALLVLAVGVGAVVSTVFAVREADKAESLRAALAVSEGRRKRAEEAEAEARAAEADAKAAKVVANQRHDITNALVEFLLGDLLGMSDGSPLPQHGPGDDPDLTLREVLDRAAGRVGTKFKSRPDLEATIRRVVGDTYLGVGAAAAAVPQLERSAELSASKYGPDTPGTVQTRMRLAEAYVAAGRPADAVAHAEWAWRTRTAKLGADEARTLNAADLVAEVLVAAGRAADAVPVAEQAYAARTKPGAAADPDDVRRTLTRLATAYTHVGRHAEAVALHERIVRELTNTPQDEPFETLDARVNLAAAYDAAGRPAAAVAVLEAVVPEFRRLLGRRHARTRDAAGHLADALSGVGDHARAADLRRDLLAVGRHGWPPDGPQLADALSALGGDLLKADKPADAVPVLRECLKIREKTEPGGWRVDNVRSMLGEALARTGHPAEAEPLLRDGYRGLKVRAAKLPARLRWMWLRDAAGRLASLYESQGRRNEAAATRAEMATLPREAAPPPRPAK